MSSGPRTRTVAEVAAPYANFLVSVPRVAFDVCDTCHGSVDPRFPRCFPCNEAIKLLGHGAADVVSAVSLAPTGGQLARDLYTYKRDTVPAQLRLQRLTGLAAVLWMFMGKHEKCMAHRVGQATFDLITTVPSTSGRAGSHPLENLVGGIVRRSAERYQPLLHVWNSDLPQRAIDPSRFQAERLDGETVLIIDDTWTTGAHAQTASAALKAAGASHTGVLSIGRWITADYGDTPAWLSAKRTAWDWDYCVLHR